MTVSFTVKDPHKPNDNKVTTIDLTDDKIDDDFARAVEISLQETTVPYADADMQVKQDKFILIADIG